MNIKVSSPMVVILSLPLLVYGQVSINEYGTATDDTSYRLECNITSFSGTATWAKDGFTQTICTISVCSVKNISVYYFTTSVSGIQVVMDPVSSIVDGLWKCTSSGNFQEINVTSIRSPKENEKVLTVEETIGTVIGCVIFLILVCVAAYFCCRKREESETSLWSDVWQCLVVGVLACFSCVELFFRCIRAAFRTLCATVGTTDPKDIKEFVYVQKNSSIEFGKPIPDATNAKWEKDGDEIVTTHRNCTMFAIINASVNHEGLYLCTLNKLRLKYYLIVVGRTEIVYVKENQDVKLGGKIPGIEYIPVVEWKKDKHDRNQCNVVKNKLQILNASLLDEGKYFCTFVTKQKLTYLLIIVGTEKTINVIEGKEIEFGKEIPDSDATSDAYWTKDGSRVESTSQKKTFYQIDAVDGNSKGLYVCHLGNKAELKYRLIESE